VSLRATGGSEAISCFEKIGRLLRLPRLGWTGVASLLAMTSLALFNILDLVAGVLFLAVAWSLYVLLKEVNPDIALLFFIVNISGVAVQCMNMINVYASIVLLSDMKTLTAFSPDQYNTMVLLFMNLQKHGFMIAQIFYGAWFFPLGYVVYKSGFLPKLIGVILMVHCFCWLATFVQYFLFPDFVYLAYVSYPLGLVAELSLTLRLLVKGAGSKSAGAVV
jgi:hypothetical protein